MFILSATFLESFSFIVPKWCKCTWNNCCNTTVGLQFWVQKTEFILIFLLVVLFSTLTTVNLLLAHPVHWWLWANCLNIHNRNQNACTSYHLNIVKNRQNVCSFKKNELCQPKVYCYLLIGRYDFISSRVSCFSIKDDALYDDLSLSSLSPIYKPLD